jgi:hypothetical protein
VHAQMLREIAAYPELDFADFKPRSKALR